MEAIKETLSTLLHAPVMLLDGIRTVGDLKDEI
jgi:hypothetical protein